MRGVFTTCTVMWRSGARTGTVHTLRRQRATRVTWTAVTARTESSAGAAGAAAPGCVAPRTGTGVRRTVGATALASAQFWPVQSRRNRAQRGRRQQRAARRLRRQTSPAECPRGPWQRPGKFYTKIEVLPPIGKGGFEGSRAFFYGHYAEGAPNATANFGHSLSADLQCFQRKIGLGVHCCWMDLRQTTLKYNKVCRQSFSFQAGIFVGFFLPFSGSVSRLQHYFFFRKFFIILEKNQEIPKTKRRRSA